MNGSEQALYLYEECVRLDQQSQALGLSEMQLMGQAALASFYSLGQLIRPGSRQQIHILCGPGNNGGDGLALAGHLLGAGYQDEQIQVYQSRPAAKPAARFYQERLDAMGLERKDLTSFVRDPPVLDGDLIVEALLGTGQSGAPRASIAEALKTVRHLQNQHGDALSLVSLDLPAGLGEDRPVVFGEELPIPDEVHCYGVARLALALNASLASAKSAILPMGFDPAVLASMPPAGRLHSDRFDPEHFLRAPLAHKYRAGHALVLGGSNGMEGALMLATDCFFASGGGIVHAFVPEAPSAAAIVGARPSLMCRAFEQFEESSGEMRPPAAVLIGPGLRPVDLEKIRPALIRLLASLDAPVILDAAAAGLALRPEYPSALRARTILTPHTGEFKTLGGEPVDHVAALLRNRALVSEWGVYCLVKDSISVLFSPAGEMDLMGGPLPGLATAGSGDCLGGILLARFARSGPGAGDVASAIALHRAAAREKLNPRADELAPAIVRLLAETPSHHERET